MRFRYKGRHAYNEKFALEFFIFVNSLINKHTTNMKQKTNCSLKHYLSPHLSDF